MFSGEAEWVDATWHALDVIEECVDGRVDGRPLQATAGLVSQVE
ncbi:MAG: hypothetical protein P8J27_03900 [Mariniblastus sp.]|nr:hypothetical protein [Mariniblastus sp.]